MCIHGQAYGYVKKIEVGAAYNAAKDANGGLSPNMSALERACKVGLYFVVKCETEMAEYGRIILHPSEIQQNSDGPVGAGSKSLDEIDASCYHPLLIGLDSRTTLPLIFIR